MELIAVRRLNLAGVPLCVEAAGLATQCSSIGLWSMCEEGMRCCTFESAEPYTAWGAVCGGERGMWVEQVVLRCALSRRWQTRANGCVRIMRASCVVFDSKRWRPAAPFGIAVHICKAGAVCMQWLVAASTGKRERLGLRAELGLWGQQAVCVRVNRKNKLFVTCIKPYTYTSCTHKSWLSAPGPCMSDAVGALPCYMQICHRLVRQTGTSSHPWLTSRGPWMKLIVL